MRIGLLTPGFSASDEDWCIPALLDLVRSLAAEHDVTVLALRYPHRRAPYTVHGARVLPLGIAQRRGLARLGMFRRALSTLERESHRRPFDVLHALWAHEPGFLATRAGARSGTPVVVSLLGGELADLPALDYGGGRTWVNRWLIRRALERADRVTAGSLFLLDLAAPRLPASKLVRWPLGVDTARFHPGAAAADAPLLAGDPVLLHVGSLVPVKDQATLLRAFQRARTERPAAHLHLVGDGPRRRTLEALAAALGLTDAVTFHGAQPHDRLPDLYRQAALFVSSSRFESQGMAVLEAAACGCRVVGTAVGVLPEVSDRSVPPGDPDRLAEALGAALAEPPDPRGDAARRVAPWDLAATTRRLVALYAALGAATPVAEAPTRPPESRRDAAERFRPPDVPRTDTPPRHGGG